MKKFLFGSGQGWDGIKRFLRVRPVANEGLYIEEYRCSTIHLSTLQFTLDTGIKLIPSTMELGFIVAVI